MVGGWRLVAAGGWRLVAFGGPSGWSLTNGKSISQRTPLSRWKLKGSVEVPGLLPPPPPASPSPHQRWGTPSKLVSGKTSCEAWPAPARKGRQGAEAAHLNTKTTVPRSAIEHTPPPHANVHNVLVTIQTSECTRGYQAAHHLSLCGKPPGPTRHVSPPKRLVVQRSLSKSNQRTLGGSSGAPGLWGQGGWPDAWTGGCL